MTFIAVVSKALAELDRTGADQIVIYPGYLEFSEHCQLYSVARDHGLAAVELDNNEVLLKRIRGGE